MKIAINASFYGPKTGGIGIYIYNLITHLEKVDQDNDYIIYLAKDYYDFALERLPAKWKYKATPYTSQDNIKRSLRENSFWLEEEKNEKFDIFHSPFFHAPKLKYARLIITVHDMRFERYPKTYTLLRYIFLKFKVRRSVIKADKIIAISQFTKDELVDLYQLPEDKIKVIHEAINREDFSADTVSAPSSYFSFLEGHPFILTVGHIEPRKNYEHLIDAFSLIKRRNSKLQTVKLVIVGKKQHNYEAVMKKVDLNKAHVVYLDFVSFDDLKWLYKNAELFVFPSFYEGFGFPPLEAAALGTVSVVSNASCIPEICGDTALYFNPFDINDMASKIELVLSDTEVKNKLENKLEDHLNRFSWFRNAEETLACYHSVL